MTFFITRFKTVYDLYDVHSEFTAAGIKPRTSGRCLHSVLRRSPIGFKSPSIAEEEVPSRTVGIVC